MSCSTDVSLCGWTGGTKGLNVFQGKVLAPSAIAFYGVPVDPPGDFTQRTFRITNLRVNASSQPPLASGNPQAVIANVLVAGLSLQNANGLIVGYSQSIVRTRVRDENGNALQSSANGVEFPNCSTVTKQRFANLRFSDPTGSQLLPPNWIYNLVAGAPGTLYNSESGFYDPLFRRQIALTKLVSRIPEHGSRRFSAGS